MGSPATVEGRVEVPGGQIWYRIAGADRPGTPVLCLHGGPGMPHDYLEPLKDLAANRPVVFCDQLGCGRSDRPADDSLWTTDRFVEELAAPPTGRPDRGVAVRLRLRVFRRTGGGVLVGRFPAMLVGVAALLALRVGVVGVHVLGRPGSPAAQDPRLKAGERQEGVDPEQEYRHHDDV